MDWLSKIVGYMKFINEMIIPKIRDGVFNGSYLLVSISNTCGDYFGGIYGQTTFFRDDYSNHVKTLITIIYDRTSSRYGSGDYSSSNIEHFPRELSGSIFSKKKIIQHFYTYQKLSNNKIYDEYRQLVKIQNRLNQLHSEINKTQNPQEKQKMNEETQQLQIEQKEIGLKFKESFSEINSKTLMGSHPSVGVCKECLKYTGLKYFRYSKWLKDKEKDDTNAWDDVKW